MQSNNSVKMEDNCVIKPDRIEAVLYVSQEDLFGVESTYLGFKNVFLLRNLTEMEQQLIVCQECEGIIREASTYEGETTCHLCSKNGAHSKSVNKIRTLVASLGVRCPLLRDCGWTGQLSEAEAHLIVCGSALVLCHLGCEHVVKRREIEEHTDNECRLRKVECEFCEKIFPFEELTEHLVVCPEHPIKCECGVELARSKQEVHVETECPLAEVECPYAKYSCSSGKMLRKDMLDHKKMFFIEHQDMLQTRFEQEKDRLKECLMRTKELDGFQWRISCLSSLPAGDEIEGPQFQVGNGEFNCVLIPGEVLTIKIRKSDRSNQSKEKIEICLTESRLIFEKSPKMNEDYFKSNKSKQKICLGKTSDTLFSIPQAVYSKYVQPDDSLCLRMYFDFANKIRRKEKQNCD